jgi:hypothetical protein
MNAKAVIAAVIGALIGAAVWAATAAWTGCEFGWIAWGVGALVGGRAMILEGSGAKMGAFCALLALTSIFIGKM